MSGSLCFQRIVVWGEPKSTARFHLAPINGAAVPEPPLRLLSRERPFIGGSRFGGPPNRRQKSARSVPVVLLTAFRFSQYVCRSSFHVQPTYELIFRNP
jgi:hypothetical protein